MSVKSINGAPLRTDHAAYNPPPSALPSASLVASAETVTAVSGASPPIAAIPPPRRPMVSPSLAAPLERRGHSVGTRPMHGFLTRGGIASATTDSVKWQSRTVDRRQAERLQHMTQITPAGSGESECTAATLAVGTFELMLAQPTTANTRLANLITELSRVRDAVTSVSTTHAASVQDAIADLERLQTRPPSTWSYGDVEELQNAFYVAMFGEEALRGNLSGSVDHDLTRRYRDRVWGTDRPAIAGVKADVAWLSDGTQGHCGLVADKHALEQHAIVNVLFDPWPQADGTTYNRASDGPRAWTDPSRPTAARTDHRMLGSDLDDVPR